MKRTEKVKAILVDDQKMIRQGLISFFKVAKANIKVIAEAENGKELFELLSIKEPDVLILDLSMPVMNGFEVLERIRNEYPLIRTIILTVDYNSSHVYKAFSLGTNAFLNKNCEMEEIEKAVYEVHNNGEYLNEEIGQMLIDSGSYRSEIIPHKKMLDENEVEILQMLCRGKKNKEIATALNISINLVDHRIKGMKKKTGLHSVVQLGLYAVKHGYFPINEPLI